MRMLALLLLVAAPALADLPVVEDVTATRMGDVWRFDVTVGHADEGWDHYADAWEVLGPDGTRLGLRPLAHPHVTEQPFTRSLGGVTIPEGVKTVTVRARDSVHGWGAAVEVPLPGP
jgi:hypothetical protein